MIKALLLLSLNLYCVYGMGAQVQAEHTIEPPEVIGIDHDKNIERLVAFRDGLEAQANHDYENAFTYLKKAATLEHGSADAMYFLGLSYINGQGTPKKSCLGLAYLDRAARSGCQMAAAQLVWIYMEGKLMPADPQKAEEYSTLVGSKDLQCRFYLGQSIYSSATINADRIMGLWLMISAAKSGLKLAQEHVKKYEMEALLSRIIIDTNLHDELRYHNGCDEISLDYEMAKLSFGIMPKNFHRLKTH